MATRNTYNKISPFFSQTHCFAPRDLLLYLVEKAGMPIPKLAQELEITTRTLKHWLTNENLKISSKKYTKLLGCYCATIME
jgi:hypothetical protein